MKSIVLVFSLVLCSFVIHAQSQGGYTIEGDKLKKLDAKWMDKVFVGGNIGLSFGTNYSYLNLSPNIGYQVTEKISVGTGISYIYTNNNGVDFHDYGGNVFTRYKILDQFFAMAQYEILNYDYGFERGRDNYSTVLLGGGITQSVGKNANIVVTALYNLLYDSNSADNGPYNSPLVVSGGISLGL